MFRKLENYQNELLWIKCLEDGLEVFMNLYNRYKLPDILEAAKKQKALIGKEKKSLRVVTQTIKKIDDPLLIDVLTMRYIDGLTLEQTSEALFFSYTHTSRLVRKAKRQLTEITNN